MFSHQDIEDNPKKKTKSQKKQSKKYDKKVLNFLKEYNKDGVSDITISEEPTPYLFIGNGGVLCGVNREELLELFNEYGHVTDLVLLPKKSFSFISYADLHSAQKACQAMDGFVFMKISHSENPDRDTTEPIAPFYVKYLKTVSLEFAYKQIDFHDYPSDNKSNLVDGLILREEFIEESYEDRLFDFFHDQCNRQQAGTENKLKHRSVVHFGYKFIYGSNNIDRNDPLPGGIPTICQPIMEEMIKKNIVSFYPDQLTVNQYLPGQGIPPHIDTHSAFEDGIISLSLKSQVAMEFTSPDGRSRPVLLPPRSLIVMKGESRYLWSHGITPRKFDIVYTQDGKERERKYLTIRERGVRISLTFRKVLRKPCKCLFPLKCDSQNSEDPAMKNWYVPDSCTEANNLEGELVYKVYEEIAEHFSNTRHSPWPRVKQFLCNLPNGSLVADVGCGNGKYLGVNKHLVMLGSDRSLNLAKICEERGFQVLVSDCLKLPYRTEAFDGCICIAVIHHLSTEERRIEAVKELVRIVREGGLVLIYVWALEQQIDYNSASMTEENLSSIVEKNEKNNISQNSALVEDKIEEKQQMGVSHTKQTSNRNCIAVCEARNTFQQQDLLVPWHLKSNKTKVKENAMSNVDIKHDKEKVFHRFYHVFKVGELERVCSSIENVNVEEIYLDCGNWCAILRKKSSIGIDK